MLKKITNEELQKFRSIPFWSWNDKLEKDKLIAQIDWMKENGIGGFFMHARSGLNTEYLSEEWMQCIEACCEHAEKIGMQAWAYDENGWPSGFVGGKLLEEEENHDRYLTYSVGAFDSNAMVSYLDNGDRLVRSDGTKDGIYINVYEHISASTADILNPDVTDKFIKHTHEEYKARYGEKFSEKIKGFFTDEPQYYRWATPYTVMIKKYFSEVLGEDILDGIGLLFFKKEGYREFRYKYWSGMQALMLENFAKRVYDWCDKNSVMLTGHYVEETNLAGQMLCCGGIMPFYEYEHIPGIDWLGRDITSAISPRQLLSASKQLGREQMLCEMYAGCGWDVTPRELKNITEYLYLNGVNVTCQHLLPYSEKGMRCHDYPAHYSDVNPWVKYNFKEFNDYFTAFGALMANSEEKVEVAVLHPIRSAYFDFQHSENDGYDVNGYQLDELDKSFKDFCRKLEQKGISYHFLDETLLKKYGSVEGNKISCGKCSYEYLIIPPCATTMDESTEMLIREYVENGGDLCISARSIENEDFIIAINRSFSEKCEVGFDFYGKYTAFKMEHLDGTNAKTVGLSLTLEPNESVILVPSNEKADGEKQYEIIVPQNKYTVKAVGQNSISIDKVSYSKNGIDYSEPMYIYFAFSNILNDRYEGDLYLKYELDVKTVPNDISFNITMPRIKSVSVNGNELAVSADFESGNINQFLKAGINEIIVKLDYYQNDNVYYVLFGENVTESLKNCLVYDSEFEPLIVKGDFGVYEKNGFINGKTYGVQLGESFVIDKAQTEITSLINGGYPFFAGKITLCQNFISNSENVKLKLNGRWHTARIAVNGKQMGSLMFDDTLDISSVVLKGENTLELELVIGNRNLLGPHHYLEEEPMMSCPFMFELQNNNNNDYRDSCSFVEPIVKA